MTSKSRIARASATTVAEKTHPAREADGEPGAASRAVLRRALLAARAAMPAEVRAAHDRAIAGGVSAWLARQAVTVLGVYWPIRCEPDLRALYKSLQADGIQLALPVMQGKDAPLLFAAWDAGAALEVDRWGIATPSARRVVMPQALLIPCVGFDASGYRLGYGAGFYDRTLASSPRPQAIGIAYAQARAAFTVAPHDIAMDLVITESASAP